MKGKTITGLLSSVLKHTPTSLKTLGWLKSNIIADSAMKSSISSGLDASIEIKKKNCYYTLVQKIPNLLFSVLIATALLIEPVALCLVEDVRMRVPFITLPNAPVSQQNWWNIKW